MDKTYKIKPLKWDDRSDRKEKPIHYSFQANTRFGSYEVKKNEWTDGWKWGYCFDEYYDDDSFSCESKQDGMKRAEKNWLERITSDLEEQTP